jgi:glucose/arabinose dehydrogenase
MMKFNFVLRRIVFSIMLLANVACAEAAESNLPIPNNTPKMRVETVAENLEIVWSIGFAPGGRMFFTERPGRVRVFENGKLRIAPLFTVPDVELSGESGLMGMALHPKFAENHFLYLAYAYQASGKQAVKVVRYRETGDSLIEPKTIIELIPAARYHAGTRLGFGPDGKLYMTTGDATNQSQGQELNTLGGKTLRLNDDGTIPRIIRL